MLLLSRNFLRFLCFGFGERDTLVETKIYRDMLQSQGDFFVYDFLSGLLEEYGIFEGSGSICSGFLQIKK